MCGEAEPRSSTHDMKRAFRQLPVRDQDRAWLAMEYVDGVDIKAVMDRENAALPMGLVVEDGLEAGERIAVSPMPDAVEGMRVRASEKGGEDRESESS